ncbi:MAG: sulfotransferase, partial [Pseudolabrys sp.]
MSTTRIKSTEQHGAGGPALARPNKYPAYAYRIWHGMAASAWFPLLARNRFAVSPTRVRRALAVSACSIMNSGLNFTQKLIFAKRIAACKIDAPPIFVIGHWRTGTTFLHELLALDERFTAPSTLECFTPGHFLVSSWFLRRLAFLLPAKRPMDNMRFGWNRPQEDEFALLNLGLGSPYEKLAFPNHGPGCDEYLNMTEVSPAHVEAWKAGLSGFLQQVIFRRNKKKKQPHGALR